MTRSAKDPLGLLLALHDEIDRGVVPLGERHARRLQCRSGCSSCCVDDLTVFEIEALRIRSRHAPLLRCGEPHAPGACAFLDGEGACRIYDDRPYVCRTQGLPLRWREDDANQPREFRDVCPLNELADEPIETLAADDCWTIGPFESRLAALQARSGVAGARVRLRDLFRVESSSRVP